MHSDSQSVNGLLTQCPLRSQEVKGSEMAEERTGERQRGQPFQSEDREGPRPHDRCLPLTSVGGVAEERKQANVRSAAAAAVPVRPPLQPAMQPAVPQAVAVLWMVNGGSV